MAIQFNDKNFETEVLKSDKVVLVDFWAPWCGPCQVMGPIIDDLAVELKDDFKIGKVNVDENQQISQRYNIMAIPALMIFKDGEIVKQMAGVQDKETLKTSLENAK